MKTSYTDLISKVETGIKNGELMLMLQSYSMIGMLKTNIEGYKMQKRVAKIKEAEAEIQRRKTEILAFEKKTGIKIIPQA